MLPLFQWLQLTLHGFLWSYSFPSPWAHLSLLLPFNSHLATCIAVKDNSWLFSVMPCKGRDKGKLFDKSWPLLHWRWSINAQLLWLLWVQIKQACHFWSFRRSWIPPKLSLSTRFTHINYFFYFPNTSSSAQNVIFSVVMDWNSAHLSKFKSYITIPPMPLTLFWPPEAESKCMTTHILSLLAYHMESSRMLALHLWSPLVHCRFPRE